MGRLRLFLEDKNASATVRMAKTILAGAELLRDFAERGKPLKERTYRRELYLHFGSGSYVLRYRTVGKVVAIIRVWHNRDHRDG